MADWFDDISRRGFLKAGAAAGSAALAAAAPRPLYAQAATASDGTYDFIVAGGGHNALVCAAYLARAGHSVVVLEANSEIGGNTATEKLTGPDFLHEPCANQPGGLLGSPPYHELELEKYGVAMAPAGDPVATAMFTDGESLTMWLDPQRTAEEIARFSTRDARAYLRLLEETVSFAGAYGDFDDTPIGYGPSMEEICAARPDGATWMRRMRQPMLDTVDEYFSEAHVRAWALWWGSMSRMPVDDQGAGLNVHALIVGRQRNSWVTMVGGCGELAFGLERLLAEHDCPVLRKKFVVELLVEEGRCVGVATADGDVYRARRGVVSSVHVQQLLEMAPDGSLPEEFVSNLEQWKPCVQAMYCRHYAMNEPPLFNVEGEWRPVVSGGLVATVEDRIRHNSAVRERRIYEGTVMQLVITATVVDPSRAPAGRHTAKMITVQPYDLADGGPARWDAIKHELAERHLEEMRPFIRNLDDGNIIASHIGSPLDIAGRNINNVGGTCHGGAESHAQMGPMRPVFGWASHRMPIDGLYQTGAGTHPGGSVTGSAGRNAAWVILDDLGTSVEEVLASRGVAPGRSIAFS